MTSSLNTYLVAYMYVLLHSNLCFLGTGLISDVSKLNEYKLLKVTLRLAKAHYKCRGVLGNLVGSSLVAY